MWFLIGLVLAGAATPAYAAVPGAGALAGLVDTVYLRAGHTLAVYGLAGHVRPAGETGAMFASALARAPVEQEDNGCSWRYRLDGLPAGAVTLVLVREAQARRPSTILRYAQLRLAPKAAARHDFGPRRILRVGPGRPFAAPAEAAKAAKDGDVVEFDAGVYAGGVAVWRQNHIVLRGAGGMAHMQAAGRHVQGKGIWVIKGNGVRVEHVEFSGARVADRNGAGIRQEGKDLSVCNGYFHDNENGLLGGGGEVLIEYSEFARNGAGDGLSHNIYIVDTERFTLRHSYSHHARIGHNVKSRARENFILYNRIMDEDTGTASYGIDLPEGGLAFIIGNLVQQGRRAENRAIISYGAEKRPRPTDALYLVNNTIVNDLGEGAFVAIHGEAMAELWNNLFVGRGVVSGGIRRMHRNRFSSSAGLRDRAGYDYRLKADSPARDAGTKPGTARGYDLSPLFQYVHKARRERRPAAGPMDIGAYEYAGQAPLRPAPRPAAGGPGSPGDWP